MLANGARWYGETPEGRRELMEKSTVGYRGRTVKIPGKLGATSLNKSGGSDHDRFSWDKPRTSSFSSTDYAIQQNKWLVASLCLM